jgi:hypothetical protein
VVNDLPESEPTYLVPVPSNDATPKAFVEAGAAGEQQLPSYETVSGAGANRINAQVNPGYKANAVAGADVSDEAYDVVDSFGAPCYAAVAPGQGRQASAELEYGPVQGGEGGARKASYAVLDSHSIYSAPGVESDYADLDTHATYEAAAFPKSK